MAQKRDRKAAQEDCAQVGDGSGTDLALRGETDPSQKVRMATIARVKFAADQLAHARSASLFANVANHYTPYFCLYKATRPLTKSFPDVELRQQTIVAVSVRLGVWSNVEVGNLPNSSGIGRHQPSPEPSLSRDGIEAEEIQYDRAFTGGHRQW